jgi:hypothetical protein
VRSLSFLDVYGLMEQHLFAKFNFELIEGSAEKKRQSDEKV